MEKPRGRRPKAKTYKITWETLKDLPEDQFGEKLFEIDSLDDVEPTLALNYLWPVSEYHSQTN